MFPQDSYTNFYPDDAPQYDMENYAASNYPESHFSDQQFINQDFINEQFINQDFMNQDFIPNYQYDSTWPRFDSNTYELNPMNLY